MTPPLDGRGEANPPRGPARSIEGEASEQRFELFGLGARLSLPVLFVLAQAPLVLFALGVTIVTALVIPRVEAEVASLSLQLGPASARSVEAFGHMVSSAWLASLLAFYVASMLGTTFVVWTQRQLTRRLLRIVAAAEQASMGGSSGELPVLANDVLGQLEATLGKLSNEIAARDRDRQLEAEQREQLSRIHRAIGMVESEEDARRVVGRALFALVRDRPAELLMVDETGAKISRALGSTALPPPDCSVRAPAQCPALHSGTTLHFRDSEALDACPRLHEAATRRSALCVPIVVMGRSGGVLHVTGEPNVILSPPRVEALEALGAAFGTRTGIMRALGTAQLQAETDALTGLFNRRSLELKGATLVGSCPRFAVVMADVDHFKRYNDGHGHGIGDRALRLFAQAARASLRPADVVARYGGEEFTFLLPDCSKEEAVRALERVRAALPTRCKESGLPSFTASFGIAGFPEHGGDLEALLRRADAALYCSKEDGRDRISIAE